LIVIVSEFKLKQTNIMATRSTIAMKQKDGSVKAVYCHWDGHIETAGKTLLEKYNTEKRVTKLISLGSISSLRDKLSTKKLHSFDVPQPNVTIAYHRDRGESLQHYVATSVSGWCKSTSKHQDYNYIFIDGEWNLVQNSGKLTLLKTLI